MPITFSPASEFTMAELADIFNKGYEAYFTVFNFDATRMQQHVENHAIVLTASRVARDEQGQPIGIACLGKRGKRGWVGGVGIYLSERGKGIGKLLMQNLIESARNEGIQDLYLEVITKNTAAHALYLKLDFKEIRRVLVIQLNELTPVEVAAEAIQTAALDEVLPLREQWQTPPNTWQYAPETLRKLPELSCLIYQTGDQAQAAIIFKRFPGEPERIQIFDAMMLPEQPEALRRLISSVRLSTPAANIFMVNLPEYSPAWKVFYDMGAQETMSQFEMLLQT